MKRFTVSGRINHIFLKSDHYGRKGRQGLATLHDVETTGNERHGNQEFAHCKDFQVSQDEASVNCMGGSGVDDAHTRANGMTSDLGKGTETEAVGPIVQTSNSRRADEYNLQKARLHANLWQQEIKKQLEESRSIEDNADCGFRDGSAVDPTGKMSDGWESFEPSESHYYDGNSINEEAMMLEEFEKRRERNRVQIASFVKQHLYGRRRPVDGWKYILNNFGKNDKTGGSALGGDGQRQAMTGNELEKLAASSDNSHFRRRR